MTEWCTHCEEDVNVRYLEDISLNPLDPYIVSASGKTNLAECKKCHREIEV